jgi:hypothetical protein
MNLISEVYSVVSTSISGALSSHTALNLRITVNDETESMWSILEYRTSIFYGVNQENHEYFS